MQNALFSPTVETFLYTFGTVNTYKRTVINGWMQTFFFNGNVIIVSNYLELIHKKIHTPNENISKTVLSVLVRLFQFSKLLSKMMMPKVAGILEVK